MIARMGHAVALSLLLTACGQKGAPKPQPTAKPTIAFKLPALEETIMETGKREGKSQWDIDCDLAFVGNLEAAKRAREALLRLPSAQQSQRSEMCEQVMRTTIKKGGWR